MGSSLDELYCLNARIVNLPGSILQYLSLGPSLMNPMIDVHWYFGQMMNHWCNLKDLFHQFYPLLYEFDHLIWLSTCIQLYSGVWGTCQTSNQNKPL